MKLPDRPAPGPWVSRAACAGSDVNMAPEMLTGAARRPTRPVAAAISHAVAVCRSCPVLDPCREWACGELDPAEGHVAGGMSWWDRVTIRRAARRAA